MFLSVEKKPVQKVAAINEENKKITYGELQNFSKTFRNFIAERELIFIFCENDLGVLCAYISSMSNNVVPLLLSADIDQKLCLDLIKSYSPAYLWVPKRCISQVPYGDVVWETMDCVLVHTGLKSPRLNDELALLLTTSGSTGSPKLVRQSNYNIHSNAEAIIKYLDIRETDRPITSLPMNYTYGLSIVNSHLLAGATLLMTSKSILQKEFWSFFKEHGATSFAGVPYHYEMLNKIHFQSMDLPSLQTMTQAGGKLSLELSRIFATFAKNTGRRFFVMYGQTEATARMGYLPYQKALDKCGSMGIAIPGGCFSLVNNDGQVINEANVEGELVYSGPNVMLGYAENQEDLSKGNVQNGVLYTGDIAFRDEDGFYYITGRKKRFLKIYGNRVNMDSCERLIKSEFNIECACTGQDDLMTIFVVDNEKFGEKISCFLSQKTGIHPTAFAVRAIREIPKNESGKIQYQELQKWSKS